MVNSVNSFMKAPASNLKQLYNFLANFFQLPILRSSHLDSLHIITPEREREQWLLIFLVSLQWQLCCLVFSLQRRGCRSLLQAKQGTTHSMYIIFHHLEPQQFDFAIHELYFFYKFLKFATLLYRLSTTM